MEIKKIFEFPSHFLFAEFFGDFPDSFSKNFSFVISSWQYKSTCLEAISLKTGAV